MTLNTDYSAVNSSFELTDVFSNYCMHRRPVKKFLIFRPRGLWATLQKVPKTLNLVKNFFYFSNHWKQASTAPRRHAYVTITTDNFCNVRILCHQCI